MYEKNAIPPIIIKIPIIFSISLLGEKSPYPTVAINYIKLIIFYNFN